MDLFKNLDNFLRPNSKAESEFKNLTKELYDNAKKLKSFKNDNQSSNQINNLVIDYMDDEAIWTQLDTENQQFLKTYIKEFCQNEVPQDDEDNFLNNDNEIYDTDDSLNDEEDDLGSEEEDEDLDEEDEEDEEQSLKDEENLNEKELNAFDDSELEDESYDDTLFKQSELNKINYDEELDDEEDEEDDVQNDEMMSEFQKADAKIKQKAKELETELLREKPWQLKGEITATERPQDSLLEEYVDFESAVRPVPIYTEEFTKKLEDIILQRVKTNKFDSVEKKERKAELPFDFKRRILLDTEKSKESLSKVYENEYLKQKNQNQQEDNPQHKEIKEKMRRIFVQLDSLCNFNYIPKSSNSEIKVINNLPAISVEEAIPDTVSDANLVAPQEIIPIQKHDLKTDLEKVKTDKLRERRLKKKIIKDKIRLKEQNGLNINFKKFKTMDPKINKKSTDSDQVKNAFMKTKKHK